MLPTRLATAIDRLLELSIGGSFSKLGPGVRSRLFHWDDGADLGGRVAVITGATSGIGYAAARQLASRGAQLVLLVRDPGRGERVAGEIGAGGAVRPSVVVADMADLASVRRAAAVLQRWPRIDALIHNAGAMPPSRQTSPDGIELTIATHLVGPFLLTQLCAGQLTAAEGRVIVVTSGGMYAQPLVVADLDNPTTTYRPTRAYSEAKRAQVSLVAACAPRLARHSVSLVAMHPGWADTPGLRTSLPGFSRALGPLLRSADEGAATITWLAAAPASELERGTLWLDRSPRPLHRTRKTRVSDTAAERVRLWAFCRAKSGVTDAELAAWDRPRHQIAPVAPDPGTAPGA